MEYRTLGKTGLKVSVVGLGTWQFGGEWGRDYSVKDAEQIIDTARETGINLIDTAECYGDHLSEELIGSAIHKDRENWIVATKFGHIFNKFLDRDVDYSPVTVRKQFEKSLKALETEYVDLLQFHSGNDSDFDTPGLWEELEKLKEEGKIRHLGISIGSNTNMYQTGAADKVGAETIQVVYNRLDTAPEESVLPICRDRDLGVLARVPLASGFLSGKYKPGSTFGEKDVRSYKDKEQTREMLEEVQRVAEEVPEGMPMAGWALAWCLTHPAVHTVIPGCKNPEQVRMNAKAAEYVEKLPKRG